MAAKTVTEERNVYFIEAMRAVAWSHKDFDDELAELRFSIERVLAICDDLERDVPLEVREHTTTLVFVLIDGAKRAATQLAGGQIPGGNPT